ncbi:MAG TPA: hypothetical protein VGL35_12460 [Rhizomicrobium sp.]|jgi:hypothetical protein
MPLRSRPPDTGLSPEVPRVLYSPEYQSEAIMLERLGLAGILLVVLTCGAAAQEMCGDSPIAPVIPAPADVRQKPAADANAAQHSAFLEIRKWQGALKSYRDCLNATVDTDKRDLGEAARDSKPDTKKMGKLEQEMTDSHHAWDASVDEEERLVNEFHAVQVAYCSRNDVDRSSCPKT